MAIVYVGKPISSDGSLASGAVNASTRCAACNDEILGTPLVRDGKCYCCEGCADGGPCSC